MLLACRALVLGETAPAPGAPVGSGAPYAVVFETYRNGNWDLFTVNADGSNSVNVTRTPDVNELYPHVSPDGTKVCFVVDEGKGKSGSRSVWYMNLDGTKRTKVSDRAREPCWNADGTKLAYLRSEYNEFTPLDFATTGIFVYDLKTKVHTAHPNGGINHLYNLCWSPDGEWFVATVHGGMGFKHAILALEANGRKVVNLGIPGCRPDLSRDGTKIAWGASDWELWVGDFDVSSGDPKITNRRAVVQSKEPMKVYHIDWSPDGKWDAFSRGPEKKKNLRFAEEMVGIQAPEWNICVADASQTNQWVAITSDGQSNKEPDWMPTGAGSR